MAFINTLSCFYSANNAETCMSAEHKQCVCNVLKAYLTFITCSFLILFWCLAFIKIDLDRWEILLIFIFYWNEVLLDGYFLLLYLFWLVTVWTIILTIALMFIPFLIIFADNLKILPPKSHCTVLLQATFQPFNLLFLHCYILRYFLRLLFLTLGWKFFNWISIHKTFLLFLLICDLL